MAKQQNQISPEAAKFFREIIERLSPGIRELQEEAFTIWQYWEVEVEDDEDSDA